jgi:hypothetical protein
MQPQVSAPLGTVMDGNFVCRSCGKELITNYVDLLSACGPVPFFREITMICPECCTSNSSHCLPVERSDDLPSAQFK